MPPNIINVLPPLLSFQVGLADRAAAEARRNAKEEIIDVDEVVNVVKLTQC